MPRSASTSALAQLRRRCSTQALTDLALPPDLLQQAEEVVVESSLAGGLFASAGGLAGRREHAHL